ncbi:MAG: ammonia-forming cytochrome c nitrite reductase [Spirochaetes bacterium]|nr:ammonia-forming cytochrome c nitrite reductase [Spirochaetota bacterium]
MPNFKWNLAERIQKNPRLAWVVFGATILVVFLVGLFASTIMERRAEALYANRTLAKIGPFESRNAVWGKNHPREYESWKKTAEMDKPTKYNGNTVRDDLAEDPRMAVLWAGYAFSKDYKHPRGHAYAVTDVHQSLRTGAPTNEKDGPQPGTCWTCKSPDVPRLMSKNGISNFYKGKWAALVSEVVNPIGCADCHEPNTMSLQISRPALVEAFARRGVDVTKASHQEMRSLVCAQCHVEYYFKGEGKYLTFPWDKGMDAESMEAYYDTAKFSDWKHALSKAPMLKAQHPDYEVYQTGLHARRGVACADCHMPYRSEGGQKFTDHHIQSPLNNIAASCQVCHRESEDELRSTVYARQDKIQEIRLQLEDALVKAHLEAKFAWDKGATEAQMEGALGLIRAAQWRWDLAVAGHGNSFHSTVETARLIAVGIEKAQAARIELVRVLAQNGYHQAVPLPDLSTKEKAQAHIGLNMGELRAQKESFLKNILPKWLQKGAEREQALESSGGR